ncbi:alpha-2-macroglobulin [Dysgonomonas sp. ZJ709]|uniref:alpha-2-macroglobulin family protein n=1 Tax=Dysgonomonas sp. ZJ709 TaxID=2709797 RepID=UPI002105ABD2|nr:alpha-2-macroglobulin family protein [Dysgonomonas sp. ZJ709]
MKKQLLIGILLILSITMIAQNSNKTYDAEWKQAEKYEKEKLPQSALGVVDKILKKAIADKNNQQVVKSLIYKDRFKEAINTDDKSNLIYDLENLISQTNNIQEKALLHSMLGTLYYEYYSSNRWEIDQRTQLEDLIPTDIQEWSTNIFIDKIRENLNLSIQDKETLKAHKTSEFNILIIPGEDSPQYYPTLYDFLMLRAIQLSETVANMRSQTKDLTTATGLTLDQLALPADQYINLEIKDSEHEMSLPFTYYQQYLKDLLNRNMTSTIIITELGKIQFIGNIARNYSTSGKELEAYIDLQKRYDNNETSVEVIDAIIGEILNTTSDSNERNEKVYYWCTKGINQYPNYSKINILKSRLLTLEEPSISISNENNPAYPNTPISINIYHKNIQALKRNVTFNLYKIEKNQYYKVNQYSPELISEKTYIVDTVKLNIGELQPGSYELVYISNESDDEHEEASTSLTRGSRVSFIVSSLTTYNRNSAENEYEIYVLDRITGKPISGASVIVYQEYRNADNEWKKVNTQIETNDLGLAVFKDTLERKNNNYSWNVGEYKVKLDSDTCLQKANLSRGAYSYRQSNGTPNSTISIFTDRSIYRPGQTVYFKAITLNRNGKPIDRNRSAVKLYNTNGDIVAEKDLISNEFGSISGEFILPPSGLLGIYYIEVDGEAQSYFNVEEYKRPTFEITFDKVKDTYSFGEEIKLKGYAKTFSGISLQDTDVEYTIKRRESNFWFRPRMSVGSHFGDGKVVTNKDGSFDISFVPKAADSNNGILRNNIYIFDITASVTDINGETQSSTYSFTVGDVSMAIKIDIPTQIEKSDSTKITINALNLEGEEIQTKGTYTLYTVNDNGSVEKTVFDGSFETGIQEGFKTKLKDLASGKYQLQVKAIDNKGKEVNEKADFVLYSYEDKKPPIKTNAWVVEKNIIFDKETPAEVIFGVSGNEVYILYQLYNNSKLFERRFINLSDSNQSFEVPYKDEYGDNVYMSFTSIKDGKFENNDILLSKKEEKMDNNLTIKLDVFRDKLLPGSKETWTISVANSNSEPAIAELLASMYDISLDKITQPNVWSLNRPSIQKEVIYPIGFNILDTNSWHFSPTKIKLRDYNQPQIDWVYSLISGNTFDKLNWFIPPSDDKHSVDIAELKSHKVAIESTMYRSKAVGGEVQDALMPKKMPSETPQIRKNFNETAFFYPQLLTNKKGETLISFTVPDSNTSWRFRILAHDKDGRSGDVEKTVVTQKKLMITPNMPRFIRQGDKTTISTKISNLSETGIKGKVSIEFFNPITDKVIYLKIANQNQTFSIEKDASTSASWTFDVPTNLEFIGCRIVAQSKTFSDGEQHALVVLPNSMLVTESMPFDVTEKGVNTFVFDKLRDNKSESLSNYRLTLEYASNPAWYAIQSLPTMTNPSTENAVSWFASYYSNSLGASIARQYPKVSAIIEAWKMQNESTETLVSKLLKNEELKNVLLEETPWVMDAKNETEQMQRLSLLFDWNNTEQLTNTSTNKLVELQTSEGGWSWYKGMGTSRNVTQYILYGYSQLQLVGQVEYPSQIKEMQMSALKYLDTQISNDFKNLKTNNKDWEKITKISTSQLEYLFVRSYYRDIPIDKDARDAERFYTSIASKNWTNLDLYESSILAVVLKQNGDKDLATKIAKSIREYSKIDSKLGMYWPNNKNQVFLSMSAVSTHTFLMNALKENGASDKDMDLMKKWLIKQKQTQAWESTHATIDAINALLSTGSNWFTAEETPINITVGGTKIDVDNKELGTGYIKTTWNKSEITSDLSKVEVINENSHPSYGALYWQYFEDMNKITSQGGDLNIEKQLFKEVVSTTGKSLQQITDGNPLDVGDKVIIRLTVRANNDMEFVQLKDMRTSCFEPLQALSGTRWQNSLLYYQTTKDASTIFYFDNLPKGTYVLEYPVYVNRTGEYTNGITTIQCLYAPEFTSHTAGNKIIVKDK